MAVICVIISIAIFLEVETKVVEKVQKVQHFESTKPGKIAHHL
jgi:hypothetical protein